MDLDHLSIVDESYFRHLITAWVYALALLTLAAIALIHGLIPFLFTNTVSRAIERIREDIDNRLNAVKSR